ncbi:MAG: FecR domain-containing protein [Deltaproteobacteria bacterium]|nr:FecR domain-containing protein [Deltaproteobacteria bacterium]
MSKPDDYLWDRSGPADPDVQRLEELMSPLAHDRPLDELRMKRPKRRAPWIAGIAVAVAAAAVLVLWLRTRSSAPCSGDDGFAFTAKGGTVGCNDGTVASGRLPVGGTLDTGTASAQIVIAAIGTAELAPGTRIRLDVSVENKRQQLHLEHGRMHARVTAPPRIFAITTPSTGVTDLGCEYTVEIDAKGKGWIEVQSGRVELETSAPAVIVAPACTTARMREGKQPSVPTYTGATPALRAAVIDFEDGKAGALARVLELATKDDAITLATLAVLGADRELVLSRLAVLSPPPGGITIRDAVANAAVLEKWREDIILGMVVASLEYDGKCPQN